MNKPRFNLKNKNESETLISMVFRPFKDRFVYSTGLKVAPRSWNDRKMRVRESQDNPDFYFINGELDKLEDRAMDIAKNYRSSDKILTRESFRMEMDRSYKELTSPNQANSFTAFAEAFVQERSSNAKYKKGTIQTYNTALLHLNGFSRKKIILFEELTVDFLLRFKNHLFRQDLSNNHVHKIISTLKTMLNDATAREVNKNLDYRNPMVKVSRTPVDNVYLTETELDQLRKLDLVENERLDRVRDLFVVACYTGLRFSDFRFLKNDNIGILEGKRVLNVIVQKTGDKVVIPIHPVVDEILAKYDDRLPKAISNQKMNVYLKELCQMAGIDQVVTQRKYYGGRMISVESKKYELVSSHTGRRSFATNAYKEGVPMLSIMRITGHKKPETFLKYIKFSNEENAMLMAKHPFFHK